MYVCMYIHTHTHKYIHTDTHTHTHTHTHTGKKTQAPTYLTHKHGYTKLNMNR